LAVEGDLKTSTNQAKLWDGATQIVGVEDVSPRQVNPALMELGALVCTPKNPRCEVCPVAKWCLARAQNRQNELPFIAPKAEMTPLFDVCVFARNERGEVLLRRRSSDAKWWQNMWELPRTTRRDNESAALALRRLSEELGFEVEIGDTIATLKHGVTRYAITLSCFEARVLSLRESDSLRWFSFEAARALPLPSTMKTLLRRLEKPAARQLSLL
jgi:A/G-specific adenine glycosylase